MAQIGLPYSGNEVWEIEDNSQPEGLQTFLKDFGDQTTRTAVLNKTDYSDGNNGKTDVVAFISRQSVKDLMGDVAGQTPRTNVVGISLHFGYDENAENIVLIARSASGQITRPTGSEFTNFNFLSKTPSDTNSNPGVSDSEADDYTSSFRTNGYTFLAGLENDSVLSVKFDNHVLARLLYSDIGPTPTISGQIEFHLVIGPAWEGDTEVFLSLVGEGKDTSNDIVYHKLPPCPPYCWNI